MAITDFCENQNTFILQNPITVNTLISTNVGNSKMVDNWNWSLRSMGSH